MLLNKRKRKKPRQTSLKHVGLQLFQKDALFLFKMYIIGNTGSWIGFNHLLQPCQPWCMKFESSGETLLRLFREAHEVEFSPE